MTAPVELIPLLCTRCQAPIPAGLDEVAWVCAQCGQGLLLSEEKGAVPLEICFAAGLDERGGGRPFWVVPGKVELQRKIFGGGDPGGQARVFWGAGRTFFVPAYTCTLDELVQIGMQMIGQAPVLQPGPAVPFIPVTMLPEDVQPYAEFIVMGIEAGRKDRLKELQFKLDLGQPVLWVLPG
jgi:hypothetical protein